MSLTNSELKFKHEHFEIVNHFSRLLKQFCVYRSELGISKTKSSRVCSGLLKVHFVQESITSMTIRFLV